ncbi:MAG: hypothetical protein V7720_07305 [Halioglobus sp.]
MELKPLQALAITVVFIIVGGPAAWFTMHGLQSTGPGDVGVNADGRLHAHFHGKVFAFDDQGQSAGVYDLDRIGATGLIGGLAFFPNGDWLIAPQGSASIGRLQRCSTLAGLSCTPLTELDRSFARTFRTFVGGEELFYLSDSSRHSLTAHSAAGKQLAANKERLRHPGEVKRYGNLLAIADVDHYRIKLFQLDEQTGLWSEQPSSFDTLSPVVSESMINQPVDFLLHDDMWYVLVKDVSMAYARLRRYTLEGDYIDHLPLPENRMIMAIEKHGKSIVLSDFRLQRLLRVGLDGTAMEDLSSPEWRQYAEQLSSTGRLSLWTGILLWTVFALLLIVGFYVAVKAQKFASSVKSKIEVEADVEPEDTGPPSVHDPAVRWLRRSRLLDVLMGVLFLMFVVVIGFAFSLKGDCAARSMQVIMYGTASLVLIVAVPFFVQWRRNRQARIGVLGNWLIVESKNGTVQRSLGSDLHHVRNTLLYVDGQKVMLGPPNNRFFHKEDFEQILEPILKKGTALSGLGLYRWRWHNDRSALYVECIITLFALALLFGMLTGGEVYIEDKLNAMTENCQLAEAESIDARVN